MRVIYMPSPYLALSCEARYIHAQALALALSYCVLRGSRVVVSGCASASPTVGCNLTITLARTLAQTLTLTLTLTLTRCNLAWAGLDQIEASDWQVRVS